MAIERQKHGAVQDTNNPVLDSTVNIVMNLNGVLHLEAIAEQPLPLC